MYLPGSISRIGYKLKRYESSDPIATVERLIVRLSSEPRVPYVSDTSNNIDGSFIRRLYITSTLFGKSRLDPLVLLYSKLLNRICWILIVCKLTIVSYKSKGLLNNGSMPTLLYSLARPRPNYIFLWVENSLRWSNVYKSYRYAWFLASILR